VIGSRRRGEAGFVTVWMLGLSVCLLLLGGASLDLWRVFSERRAIAAMADAAAHAGASGISERAYRCCDSVELEPQQAMRLAQQNLASQTDGRSLTGAQVDADTQTVTVRATGSVNLTLLRIFTDGAPIQVRVTSQASPRRSP
jgi:Flp pilus assembly protein TadG